MTPTFGNVPSRSRGAGPGAETIPEASPVDESAAIVLDGLSRRYRRNFAVDSVTGSIRSGVITGLFGRNGAGKTTLLRLIAGQLRPSSGSVTVRSADPFDNAVLAPHIVFIREDQVYPDIAVRDVLAVVRVARPAWNQRLADNLTSAFDLPVKRKVKKLSRGMRSALGIIVGLASGAEVTLMDEPIAGLDPVARQVFYDALLATYAERPRTIVISTHLIDEIDALVEDVVMMRRGRIVLQVPAAEVSDLAVAVSGPRSAVEALASRRGADVRVLAGRARSVIHGRLGDDERAAAIAAGARMEALTLQEILVEQDEPSSRVGLAARLDVNSASATEEASR